MSVDAILKRFKTLSMQYSINVSIIDIIENINSK
jgi:hypothetical protein